METKAHLLNHLARALHLTSYLELATVSTGLTFADVDEPSLAIRDRYLGRATPDFDDGSPVTASTSTSSVARVVDEALRDDPTKRYDLIFVDPWHTYEVSMADTLAAARLLDHRGILVVHDVLPHDVSLIGPHYQPDEWCGSTFHAFMDLIRDIPWNQRAIIDIDYGCGILLAGCASSGIATSAMEQDDAWTQWDEAGTNEQRHEVLVTQASSLCQIISADEVASWINSVVEDSDASLSLGDGSVQVSALTIPRHPCRPTTVSA